MIAFYGSDEFWIERQSSHIRPRSQTREPPRRAWSSSFSLPPWSARKWMSQP